MDYGDGTTANWPQRVIPEQKELGELIASDERFARMLERLKVFPGSNLRELAQAASFDEDQTEVCLEHLVVMNILRPLDDGYEFTTVGLEIFQKAVAPW